MLLTGNKLKAIRVQLPALEPRKKDKELDDMELEGKWELLSG